MTDDATQRKVGSSKGFGLDAQAEDRKRTSYLTADEVQAAQTLHKRAPFVLCDVSMGFFSIARHYGGMTYKGCHYTYMPLHDECVRDDVLRLVTRLRRKPANKNGAAASDELALLPVPQSVAMGRACERG